MEHHGVTKAKGFLFAGMTNESHKRVLTHSVQRSPGRVYVRGKWKLCMQVPDCIGPRARLRQPRGQTASAHVPDTHCRSKLTLGVCESV